MVEVGCLGFLSGILVDRLSDTTLTLLITGNTLKCDIPITPETKNSLYLDTSNGKLIERTRKTKIITAAAESASAMVALPGGPSGVTTLAPREELRWDVKVWMTKGP